MIADPHQIQRLRFTPGQDLLARDFRDGETFEARLRHWHVRAIHQGYGVSVGLRAQPIKENTEVTVDPGIAYDAKGRELFLPTTRTIAVPTIKSSHLLVLRHGAELLWIPEERLQTCDSVPVARIADRRGEGLLDKTFILPAVRPLARPRIGYGSTAPGGTSWQAELLSDSIVSLNLEIDTRAAGFTRPPCYFAWLQGRFLYPDSTGVGAPVNLPPFLHPSIEAAKLTGFRLRVLVTSPLSLIPDDSIRKTILARARQNLSICWMGIQMDREIKTSSEVDHGNP
jgi:hypothetical protein